MRINTQIFNFFENYIFEYKDLKCNLVCLPFADFASVWKKTSLLKSIFLKKILDRWLKSIKKKSCPKDSNFGVISWCRQDSLAGEIFALVGRVRIYLISKLLYKKLTTELSWAVAKGKE